MKKFLLVLTLLGGYALSSSAQTKTGVLSIGAEGGLPVGNYSDLYKFGYGGSFKYEYPINSDKAYVTFSAGYINYGIKDDAKAVLQFFGSNQSSSGFVPVKVGGKYYLDSRFYAEGQLGAAISTSSGGGTAFAYSPGVDYTIGHLDLGLRYEAWSKNSSTFGQFGIRAGYRF